MKAMNNHKRPHPAGRTLRVALCLSAFAALSFGQAPTIRTNGTLNAADYSRSFAPGGLISIFGTNLGSAVAQPLAFPLPPTLAGVSVELASNGEQFPLWYVSPTQINAQMPYDIPTGSVQVRVRNAAGVSNVDTITVSARAPRIFALDFSGAGPAVATTTKFAILSDAAPATPADTIVLWMNSMGASSGNPVAGQPAPGSTAGSQASTITGVTATVSGQNAPVTFAGLSPGSAGLYQVNVQMPFVVITGAVPVQVTVGGVTTQASVTVPYRQMGFYQSLLGGKAVSGQTLNGVGGATSALAFRQSDATTWGTTGLNAWNNNTGLGSDYSTATGLAVTLKNGATVVYDNNGIETGTTGNFYNNAGGGPDAKKPGLSDLYSMSNYFPLTFAGYLKLGASTTVTELIGYFDTLGSTDLPFDPNNGFVRYRMNIYSNASGTLPKETGTFIGDVFSSDSIAGTFSFSDSGVKIISSDPKNAPKSLYRLSYKLAAPLTLPAGEYWFSHDASIRATPALTSVSPAFLSDTAEVVAPLDVPSVSTEELSRHITSQGRGGHGEAVRFFFFGREMTYQGSWSMPGAVTVRPSAPVVR
jgi:uncharacterized protein (TIGR03437 family)